MNELFLRFCFLSDLFKLHFLLDTLDATKHHYWWKYQFFKYFWRMLLKFEEKNLEIHKHSWLLITWILKTWNSLQTFVKDIHWRTQTVTSFVFYPNNHLAPLQILRYQESTIYKYAFLSSNVKKYNSTVRHLKYSYTSILTNLLRTSICKNRNITVF